VPAWLGETDHTGPITLSQVKRLLSSLWAQEGEGRTISDEVKAHFLAWLVDETGLDKMEVGERLAGALERIFAEVADEYGPIDPERADARFIHLFILDPASRS